MSVRVCPVRVFLSLLPPVGSVFFSASAKPYDEGLREDVELLRDIGDQQGAEGVGSVGLAMALGLAWRWCQRSQVGIFLVQEDLAPLEDFL